MSSPSMLQPAHINSSMERERPAAAASMLASAAASTVPIHALAGAHGASPETTTKHSEGGDADVYVGPSPNHARPGAPDELRHDRGDICSHGTADTPPTSFSVTAVSLSGGEKTPPVHGQHSVLSPTSVSRFPPSAATGTGKSALERKESQRGTGTRAFPPFWGEPLEGGELTGDDVVDELRCQRSIDQNSAPCGGDRRGFVSAEQPSLVAPASPGASSAASPKVSSKKDHPLLREAPSRETPSSAVSRSSRRKKKKSKSRGGRASGGGSNGDFASIMAAIRKKTFFRPYMFSSKSSRRAGHRRGKSDASDSLYGATGGAAKPPPLRFGDRVASAPARDASPPAIDSKASISGRMGRRFSGARLSRYQQQQRRDAEEGAQRLHASSPATGPMSADREEECEKPPHCSIKVQRTESTGVDNVFIMDEQSAAAAAAVVADISSFGKAPNVEHANGRCESHPPPLRSVIVAKEGGVRRMTADEAKGDSWGDENKVEAAAMTTTATSRCHHDALAPRNRASVPNGLAQHLRGLLYDITFDCGGDAEHGDEGRRESGPPHRSSSMIDLFRDGSLEAEKAHSESNFWGGYSLEVPAGGCSTMARRRRSSELRSLGSLTDSCFDVKRSVGGGSDGEREDGGDDTSVKRSPKEDEDDVDEEDENEGLCYDSDPGELKFLRSRHLELLGSSHASWDSSCCDIGCKASRSDSSLTDDEEGSVNVESSFGVHLLSMGSAFEDDDWSYDAVADLKDDESIRNLVEGARNRKMDVIWHPNVNQTDGTFEHGGQKTPVRCTAWIEMGPPTRPGEEESPKFRWKANVTSARAVRRRRRNDSYRPEEPFSIDIADIVLVSATSDLSVERSSHPFAWGSRSFIVRTRPNHTLTAERSGGADYLFETATKTERDDDVNALKLFVARHGSRGRSSRYTLEGDPRAVMNLSSEAIWVSANIEDVDCEDVFVPPHPCEMDTTKDEVELVMPPDGVRCHTVMKVQERRYYES